MHSKMKIHGNIYVIIKIKKWDLYNKQVFSVPFCGIKLHVISRDGI